MSDVTALKRRCSISELGFPSPNKNEKIASNICISLVSWELCVPCSISLLNDGGLGSLGGLIKKNYYYYLLIFYYLLLFIIYCFLLFLFIFCYFCLLFFLFFYLLIFIIFILFCFLFYFILN